MPGRVSSIYPVNIYLFKVNNKNNRKRCEICSKLTIKTTERHWRRSDVFIVNSEHISLLFLVFLLLTLNIQLFYFIFYLFRVGLSPIHHQDFALYLMGGKWLMFIISLLPSLFCLMLLINLDNSFRFHFLLPNSGKILP